MPIPTDVRGLSSGAFRATIIGLLAGVVTLVVATVFFWQQGSFETTDIAARMTVETGDCVDVSDDDAWPFEPADCAQPHNGEIVSIIDHPDPNPDNPYPGEQSITTWFAETCRQAANAYLGVDVRKTILNAAVVVPTEDDWDEGFRQAVCHLRTSGGETVEGSVEGRGSDLIRSGTVAVRELVAGDCFTPADEQDSFDLRSGDGVNLTDCTEPYNGLFFGRADLPYPAMADFPSGDDLSSASTAVCSQRFEEYFEVESSIGFNFRFWRPSRTDWDDGSREVLCAVLSDVALDFEFVPADFPPLADLETGQCFVLLPEHTADDISLDDHVRPIECTEPHPGQMLGAGELDAGDDFPGEADVRNRTEDECRDLFVDYVGIVPSDSVHGRFPYWYPDEQAWSAGDTRFACAILGEADLTESVENSRT